MTGDLGDTPVAGSPVTTLPAFLALGDSYSIGQGVEAGGRWPVQLARALRLEGRDLGEPRIVATTGWTTDELDAGIDAAQAQSPIAGEHVLVKHRYSAFQRSNLETLMRVRGRDQLLVTGVYAHIGCTATVVEAFQRDIEAFIAADAVADFSRADHDQALHWIARTSGVPMTTDQLLEVL